MYYVYLLRSLADSKQTYVGFTEDLKARLVVHNRGGSHHTSKYKPWELVSYQAFRNQNRASDFEKYLKSGSGQAFARKRFW